MSCQKEMIECACGCGKLIPRYGHRGQENRYAQCHHGKTDKTIAAAINFNKAGIDSRREKRLTKNYLIQKYIDEKLTCCAIAEELDISLSTVARALARHGLMVRESPIGAKNEKHHMWKGGTWKDSNGYTKIRHPEHPKANNQGYVLEHVLVVEQKYGRTPTKGEHIHHINGVKDDNSPDNLILCTSTQHAAIHSSYEALLTTLMTNGIVKFNGIEYVFEGIAEVLNRDS